MFCNLCVCVCVCMHACACMLFCECVCPYVYVWLCECACVCEPLCPCVCVCVCVCVCMCFLSGCQFCCSLVRWSRPAGKPKSYRPDGRPCCLPWPCASPCTSSGCSSHSWCSTGDPPLDNRQKTQVNFITSLHSSHGTQPCHWTTDRKHKWTLSHHFIAHMAHGPATGQQTENTSELYHITSSLTRHRALPLDNRQKTQVNFITSLHSSHGTGPTQGNFIKSLHSSHGTGAPPLDKRQKTQVNFITSLHVLGSEQKQQHRYIPQASKWFLTPICNVQLADEIMLISIISLIFIFAHAPVLSNLIYTKHA